MIPAFRHDNHLFSVGRLENYDLVDTHIFKVFLNWKEEHH